MNDIYTERLRVRLYDQDLMRIGKELAQHTQALAQLELQKKETMTAIGAGMSAEKARIAELTNKINQGYEEREVECTVVMDVPRPGLKTIIRADTGDEVRVETMNEADRQQGLDLQPSPPDPPVEKVEPPPKREGPPAEAAEETPEQQLRNAWQAASWKTADERDLLEDWLASLIDPPTPEEYHLWMRAQGLEPPAAEASAD